MNRIMSSYAARLAATVERGSFSGWDVVLPDGWSFSDGGHTRICASRDKAENIRLNSPIEHCKTDCDCFQS